MCSTVPHNFILLPSNILLNTKPDKILRARSKTVNKVCPVHGHFSPHGKLSKTIDKLKTAESFRIEKEELSIFFNLYDGRANRTRGWYAFYVCPYNESVKYLIDRSCFIHNNMVIDLALQEKNALALFCGFHSVLFVFGMGLSGNKQPKTNEKYNIMMYHKADCCSCYCCHPLFP